MSDIYKCTYSGYPDEPYGGPTCAKETKHAVSCPKCGQIVARCNLHGGLEWATKVATELHAELCKHN